MILISSPIQRIRVDECLLSMTNMWFIDYANDLTIKRFLKTSKAKTTTKKCEYTYKADNLFQLLKRKRMKADKQRKIHAHEKRLANS